jgi:hypothetical protein
MIEIRISTNTLIAGFVFKVGIQTFVAWVLTGKLLEKK